jgi:hypothetical protein
VPVLSFGRGLARTVASEQFRRSFLDVPDRSSGFEAPCEARWSLGTDFRQLASGFTARRGGIEWARGHCTLPHIKTYLWWACQEGPTPGVFAPGLRGLFSVCAPLPLCFLAVSRRASGRSDSAATRRTFEVRCHRGIPAGGSAPDPPCWFACFCCLPCRSSCGETSPGLSPAAKICFRPGIGSEIAGVQELEIPPARFFYPTARLLLLSCCCFGICLVCTLRA